MSNVTNRSVSILENGYGTITSENGYMQLGIWVAELKGTPRKGDFLIIGTCGWLKTPLTRKADAISLAIDDFTWDQIIEGDNEDVFSLTFQYTRRWADNLSMSNAQSQMMEETAHEKAAQVGTNGIYFSWDLPNDYHSTQGSYEYRDMVFLISGKGCLRYPTLPQDFSVYLRYAHLQYALTNSVSFGWSSGDQPGVTMETGITSEEKYYTFHIPFYGYTP